MNTKVIRLCTLLSYIGVVVINFLATTLPIGGRNTGEVSDSYPNLFAPAGYAFSIWGLIYLLLGIYVIYQLKENKNELLAKINKLFILNAILNSLWIFAWHYDLIWLSVIFMLGLLWTLIRIAETLRTNTFNRRQTWLVRVPFSVYFGWITVATIANITIFLVSIGWNGFGFSDSFWTIIVLLVGAMIGVWRMLRDRFFAYGLVLIWAYGAILFKHLSETGFSGQYPGVIATTVLCITVFIGTTLYISFKKDLIK